MNKSFSHTTAIITVRIDSEDRLFNLCRIVDRLREQFPEMPILLIEHDSSPKVPAELQKLPLVSYHFRLASGCFHKSRLLNEGAALSTTPLLLFYDSDVIISTEALQSATELISAGRGKFVFPYNGVMLQVRKPYVESFLADLSGVETSKVCGFGELPSQPERFEYLYGEKAYPCNGGALLAERSAFFRVGGYNENIVSYSCEDIELWSRVQKLLPGQVHHVSRSNIFHLEHQRGDDSRYNGFHEANRTEWFETRDMSVERLWAYSQNRFRHFISDTSRSLQRRNTPDEFSVKLTSDLRPSLNEVVFIWNLRRGKGRGFELFMAELEQLYSDYLVILVEVGDYRHAHRRHQTNLLYIQLLEEEQWVHRAIEQVQRPFVLLCGSGFKLAKSEVRRSVERLRKNTEQITAYSGGKDLGGLLFHRDLVDHFHSAGKNMECLLEHSHSELLDLGLSLQGELKEGRRATWKDWSSAYRRSLAFGHSILVKANRKIPKLELPRTPFSPTKLSTDTKPVSLVLTTYSDHTLITQACLEKVLGWKEAHHELVVVVHDESPMMRLYLEKLRRRGDIDQLIFTVPGHGHLAGVNCGFARATHDVVFNLCVDVLLGPGTLDRCTEMLLSKPSNGLIGWHYNWAPDHDGTIWQQDGSLRHTVRKTDSWMKREGQVNPDNLVAICSAPWYTGRTLEAVGTSRILCVNGSFFGVRKVHWEEVGGFDETRFEHFWADDFLCYGLLDQGLDILNLPPDIRCSQAPGLFMSRSDWKWEGREDPLDKKGELRRLKPRHFSGQGLAECEVLTLLGEVYSTMHLLQESPPEDWLIQWRELGVEVIFCESLPTNYQCLVMKGQEPPGARDGLEVGGVLVTINSEDIRFWWRDPERSDYRPSVDSTRHSSKGLNHAQS